MNQHKPSFAKFCALFYAAGRARSFATAGYAVCMLLYGQLIDHFGYDVI